jgi:GntR family transcriptional regulator
MQEAPIPIYYTISSEIIRQIKSRHLAPGDKVPSENEIIKNYGVSNTTARKVLQEIERGGFVEKIKGRGTFVRDQVEINRAVSKVLSFTKNMQQQGITPHTKLLDCSILTEGVSRLVHGQPFALNEPVCRITRLRFGDGKPILKEVRYISLSQCPGIEKQALEGSLYNIYEQQYHLHITRIDQALSAIIIDQSQKHIFGNNALIPGFRVDGVTFCAPDTILEIEESVYNGEIYRFSIEAAP